MGDIPATRSIRSSTGSRYGMNEWAINNQGAGIISGDVRITDPIVIGTVNVSVDISGDVTTVPKTGEVWPVQQFSAFSVAVSGDVSTTPKAGQTWQTREQGVVGTQVIGGSIGGQFSQSGDFNVREQGKTGVHVSAGLIGISGDITATNLDIRDLTIATDSVRVGGGTIGVSGDVLLRSPLPALASGDAIIGQMKIAGVTHGIATRRIIVTSSPAQITAILNDRKALRVFNFSGVTVYLSESDVVTSGDGWPILTQTDKEFPFSASIAPYMMANSGSNDCRVMDIA